MNEELVKSNIFSTRLFLYIEKKNLDAMFIKRRFFDLYKTGDRDVTRTPKLLRMFQGYYQCKKNPNFLLGR